MIDAHYMPAGLVPVRILKLSTELVAQSVTGSDSRSMYYSASYPKLQRHGRKHAFVRYLRLT